MNRRPLSDYTPLSPWGWIKLAAAFALSCLLWLVLSVSRGLPFALLLVAVLFLLAIFLYGCAGPGLVRCSDHTLAFLPDLQTDRATDPSYCPGGDGNMANFDDYGHRRPCTVSTINHARRAKIDAAWLK